MENYQEERFDTRATRDERWEQLMLVKPNVHRGTDQIDGKIVYWVNYPVLVLPSTSNTRNAVWS